MSTEIKTYKNSKEQVMAILIPSSCKFNGINFITDNEYYQQIACMNHLAGHNITPHFHNRIRRTVEMTCETLVIRKGILRVILYEDMKEKHKFNVCSGDILALFSGGHGFKVIEDVDMIEIKQGPFLGDIDKTRF